MNRFLVGATSVDITPELPAALVGQYYHRLAVTIHTRLYAQILAVEGRSGSAVFVACDLLAVPDEIVPQVREAVKALAPDFPVESILMSAIHTHTAPSLTRDHGSKTWGRDFDWTPSREDEQTPEAYAEGVVKNIAEGILRAWNSRRPAVFATGMDHVSISYNRRTVYTDQSAVMYGSTNRPDFLRMEGATDNSIHFMSFEDASDGSLIAAVVELACPAQVLEHHDYVAADYWADARRLLAERWGDQAVLIGLCGAAGDLSPRDLVQMARPETAMHSTAMYQEEGSLRIARRILDAFTTFMNHREIEEQPDVVHHCRVVRLPLWLVTEEEAAEARDAYQKQRALHARMADFTEQEAYALSISAGVVLRWELQQKTRDYPVEIHALRIGSAWMATNPFELFVEYADRIRSRMGGGNIFISQLTGGYQGYLPSAVAIEHKGYSALICNGMFGAEGGDRLVEETLSLLQSLQAKENSETRIA
ncbi:MAG: hypothetical protein PUB93_02440 [Firmicutes bacterium]|nr:hypothetical protein [Bacillota bacterium]